MIKAMVLTGDYWHSRESIAPLMPLLFKEGEEYLLTEDPRELYSCGCETLISFKDPIENDQIPTPVWCDEKWTDALFERIEKGMGFIAVHAAVTDLSPEHRIVKEIYESVFITHPAPCTVSFETVGPHPVLEGISGFTFPHADEHYQMEMFPACRSDVIAYTLSENGRQPALWVNKYGEGRCCMFTPGHDTENITCPEYVRLMRNMLDFCGR